MTADKARKKTNFRTKICHKLTFWYNIFYCNHRIKSAIRKVFYGTDFRFYTDEEAKEMCDYYTKRGFKCEIIPWSNYGMPGKPITCVRCSWEKEDKQ